MEEQSGGWEGMMEGGGDGKKSEGGKEIVYLCPGVREGGMEEQRGRRGGREGREEKEEGDRGRENQ